MQEPLERSEAGKPFAAILRADLGFAEFFRVVQVQEACPEEPSAGMSTEKYKHSHEQTGHEEESAMQERVIFTIQRVGVGLVLSEPRSGIGMTLPAGLQDVGLGEP